LSEAKTHAEDHNPFPITCAPCSGTKATLSLQAAASKDRKQKQTISPRTLALAHFLFAAVRQPFKHARQHAKSVANEACAGFVKNPTSHITQVAAPKPSPAAMEAQCMTHQNNMINPAKLNCNSFPDFNPLQPRQ